MWKVLKARWIQKYRTGKFPDAPPVLPDRFRGWPEIHPANCTKAVVELCPVDAIAADGSFAIDLGRCIFCGKCEAACPEGICFSKEYRLGALTRSHLIADGSPWQVEQQRNETLKNLCGKSLKIRQVSAGGCAACELDFNVLQTLAWDMGRFGIQIVASPRHADCLLVTGPVSNNMRLALKKTYDAMPKPSFVIACGSCAVSGGLYADSPETSNGVEEILPVDCFVPGCPPHPATLLEALLRMIGRK